MGLTCKTAKNRESRRPAGSGRTCPGWRGPPGRRRALRLAGGAQRGPLARQHRLHPHRLAARARPLGGGRARSAPPPRLSAARAGRLAPRARLRPRRPAHPHAAHRPAVCALAGVLLVVPMFYLGRELFNRRLGFWAALLVQCLPVSGREMADGLSEPLFLLASAAALVFACRALRLGSAAAFALAGLCSGLAYLVRRRRRSIAAMTGLVLLGMQAVPRRRRPWRRFPARRRRPHRRARRGRRPLRLDHQRADDEAHRQGRHRPRRGGFVGSGHRTPGPRAPSGLSGSPTTRHRLPNALAGAWSRCWKSWPGPSSSFTGCRPCWDCGGSATASGSSPASG